MCLGIRPEAVTGRGRVAERHGRFAGEPGCGLFIRRKPWFGAEGRQPLPEQLMFSFRQYGEAPDCGCDDDKSPPENQPGLELQNRSGYGPGAKSVEYSPHEDYHRKMAGIESK